MGVGIYGGTFDPVHLGHLAIADDVAQAFELSEVIFVPASRAPLRQPAVAGAVHRMQMCRIATAGNPRFRVSEVDQERPAPSYTIDTLAALRKELPGAEFWLIAGTDVLAELREWREVRKLLAETRLIVVARPGFDEGAIDALADELGAEGRLLSHRSTSLQISSSEIRRRIAEGLPFKYYLREGVYEYIRRHGLYGYGLRGASG